MTNMKNIIVLWVALNWNLQTDGRLIDNTCGIFLARNYDYIIAGGGTAGSVLAARLSENPKISVLVIEAGGTGQNDPAIETPALRFSVESDVVWNYKTEPQEAALFGNKDRISLERTGKLLGGTSSIGASGYFRGFKSEFDHWARNGAKGWSYKEILPYFLKSEGTRIPEFKNSSLHNTCGPLATTFTTLTPPVEVWFRAAKELRIPEVDCNQGSPDGICRGQVTVNNGKRVSAATAFLWPVIGRRNLDVLTHAVVTKVLISRRTRQAVGLEFIYKERIQRISANREVVLSAGGYGTPKILQLSGIGPIKLLRKLKIPVLSNLPVGENLQVQPEIIGGLFSDISTLTINNFTDPDTLAQYVFQGKGLFADKSTTDASLYFQKSSGSANQLPDFQIVLQEGLRANLSTIQNQPRAPQNRRSTILVFLLHPRSRGTVRIKSRNFTDLPSINPRFFTLDQDVNDLVIATRKIQNVLKAPSLRKVKAQFEPVPLPSCGQFEYDTDKYWQCFIRYKAASSVTPISTSKMGAIRDVTTVVDPKLRVKGIDRLRIVDASIMPDTAGRSYATVMMIAEKAADLILDCIQ